MKENASGTIGCLAEKGHLDLRIDQDVLGGMGGSFTERSLVSLRTFLRSNADGSQEAVGMS